MSTTQPMPRRSTQRGAMRLVLAAVPLVLLVGCGAQEQATPAVAPPDDAVVNQARFDCLSSKGLAVTRDANGGVSFVDPKDNQGAAYRKADRECTEQLVSQGLIVARTADDLRTEYALATSLHQCMAAAGLPVADWPSWERYLDDGGQFNVLAGTKPMSLEDARAACPTELEKLEQGS